MTREEHLRRVAFICCHCLRNIAFYRAGWRRGSLIFKGQFWINVNGNFLDICVLEWCKLFGDSRGKHYWRKVISDPTAFFNGFLQKLEMTEEEFKAYINKMKGYRDKFIAHLDLERIMNLPKLDVAKNSMSYLYNYLLTHEDKGNYFIDAPEDASTFYESVLKEGLAVYGE